MHKLHGRQNYGIRLIKGFSFRYSTASDTQTDMQEETKETRPANISIIF